MATDDADAAAPDTARLANGWGRLEIGLARSWMWHLGGYQGVVLGRVVELAWWAPIFRRPPGAPMPDPEPVRLNVSELARQTGLAATHLNRAKRRLIAQGLLVEHPGGLVEPSKRYDLGGFPPGSSMLDYCRAGADLIDQARAGRPATRAARERSNDLNRERSNALDRQRSNALDRERSNALDHQRSSGEVHLDHQRSSDLDHQRSSDLDHRRSDPGPVSIGKEINPRGEQFTPAPACVREDRPAAARPAPAYDPAHPTRSATGDDEPFIPPADPAPGPAPDPGPRRPSLRRQMSDQFRDGGLPGPHAPDPEALAKVQGLIDAWFPMRDDLSRDVRLYSRAYPSAWILKAVRRGVVRRPRRPTWAWFDAILSDWEILGEPDAGPEDAYDDEMNRLPPSAQRRPARKLDAGPAAAAAPVPPPVEPLTGRRRERYVNAPPPPAAPAAAGNPVVKASFARLMAKFRPDGNGHTTDQDEPG